MRVNQILFFFGFSLFFSGCTSDSIYDNAESDKQEGLNFANQFFQLLKDKRYEETFKLYDDTIWSLTSKQELLKFYSQIDSVVGPLVTIEIHDSNTTRIGGSHNFAQYNFIFHNIYTRGKMREQLSLRRMDHEKIKIYSYKTNILK